MMKVCVDGSSFAHCVETMKEERGRVKEFLLKSAGSSPAPFVKVRSADSLRQPRRGFQELSRRLSPANLANDPTTQ
ncbi:MAG: hypothetical protein U0X92_14650 [Anaerolineales bacterium]